VEAQVLESPRTHVIDEIAARMCKRLQAPGGMSANVVISQGEGKETLLLLFNGFDFTPRCCASAP
jgi:hypothetical protein